MPGHTLKVTLDRDVVSLHVECNEPDGALCRKACTEGCEDYCSDPENHIKPIDYCLAVEWFAAEDITPEYYAGAISSVPLSNGMEITVRWNRYEEQWEWKPLMGEWEPDPMPINATAKAATA